MPTYAYRCDSCGNQYEKRESFSAPARQKCPKCGKVANRVLFAPPIVFKGSGFYSTDSRGAGGSSGDSDGFSPADATNGHGHSHGDGGHTHDSSSESAESAAAS